MKVLHVWNTAGVASTLAKYQSKVLGWKTWVIARKKYDPYGLTTYGEALNTSAYGFALRALLYAARYDVIHVHDLDSIIPLIRLVHGHRKHVVIHYHGSSIRDKWLEKRARWSRADLVIVATRDLLASAPKDAEARFLPNPVDTELFRPLPHVKREPGTALFFYDETPKLKSSLEWARETARKLGLKLVVHDRSRRPIPYKLLPEFLNRFEYFIDHNWVEALSKTALEALACGLKVVRWDGRVLEGLPVEHKPEVVVRRLARLYAEAGVMST